MLDTACGGNSQARKLQEMFKALQQENEELKRHLGMRGNAAGGNSVARPGAPVPRGGGHSGRQMSPFNGRTQMVSMTRQAVLASGVMLTH